MPNDLLHAMIQIPLATAVAIAYFREAFSISDHVVQDPTTLRILGFHVRASRLRVWLLTTLGAIAGAFVSWRAMVVLEAVPPDYRMDGGQLAQTMLLVGIAIAYYLLKEPRRKT